MNNRKVITFKLSPGAGLNAPGRPVRNIEDWIAGGTDVADTLPVEPTREPAEIDLSTREPRLPTAPAALPPAGQYPPSVGGFAASVCSEIVQDLVETNLTYIDRCAALFGALFLPRSPFGFATVQTRLLRESVAHVVSANSRAAQIWARRCEEAAMGLRNCFDDPLTGVE